MERSDAISLGIDIGGSSMKCAAMEEGRVAWTRSSERYERPGREELIRALKNTVGTEGHWGAIGLCAPGLLDRSKRMILAAVNMPALVGLPLDELVAAALGAGAPQAVLLTDTHAAAHHLYHERKMTGRLLLLALGTGVGAAVLDGGGPMVVDGESPGHFGQMDVSIEGVPVIGPDGGAGGLEGYIGAAALRSRYGVDFFQRLPGMGVSEVPLRALVRAMRIGHAMFRPAHICLAGAIGNALAAQVEALRAAVNEDLTNIARVGWTLSTGTDGYDAARGAAEVALMGVCGPGDSGAAAHCY
jgi:predicted NBD/HSP70 family sugar kinase